MALEFLAVKLRRTGLVTLVVGLVVISASSCTSLRTEQQPPKPRDDIEVEEPKRPEIYLAREGHLVVGAKHRELSWEVSDPSGLASVEARVLKIEDSTIVSTEVHRSNRPTGRVDLNALGYGPSLYALMVNAVNNEKDQNEAGIRFSYADTNPDCPSEKAWWPQAETSPGVSKRAQAQFPDRSVDEYNILGMSRLSQFVVTGSVSDLVACLTKDGHLFTFVVFREIRTIQKEGKADAPSDLILRVPGGTAYGRVEIVTDAPVFRLNEQVLLFLTRDPQQQVPIVQGVNGVFFIEDEQIRSYGGPLVIGVGNTFDIELDGNYEPDPKHARHWDPNLRAVRKGARATTSPIGTIRSKRPERRQPLNQKSFFERLDRAWAEAGRLGRTNIDPRNTIRRPYGETPSMNPGVQPRNQ